jgi:hypothetical protein
LPDYQKPALGGFFDFWSVSLAKMVDAAARIVPPLAVIVPDP